MSGWRSLPLLVLSQIMGHRQTTLIQLLGDHLLDLLVSVVVARRLLMIRVRGILTQNSLALLLFLFNGGLQSGIIRHLRTLLVVVMVELLDLLAGGCSLAHLFGPSICSLQNHFLLRWGLLRVVNLALCCLLRVQQSCRHGFQTINDALLRLDLGCGQKHVPVIEGCFCLRLTPDWSLSQFHSLLGLWV